MKILLIASILFISLAVHANDNDKFVTQVTEVDSKSQISDHRLANQRAQSPSYAFTSNDLTNDLNKFLDLQAREGLEIEGPGTSGGGNIIIADLIYIFYGIADSSRFSLLDQIQIIDLIRFIQTNEAIYVTSKDIKIDGVSAFYISDKKTKRILIQSERWSQLSGDQRIKVAAMILKSLV